MGAWSWGLLVAFGILSFFLLPMAPLVAGVVLLAIALIRKNQAMRMASFVLLTVFLVLIALQVTTNVVALPR